MADVVLRVVLSEAEYRRAVEAVRARWREEARPAGAKDERGAVEAWAAVLLTHAVDAELFARREGAEPEQHRGSRR